MVATFPPSRNAALDGLRGYAAIIVVVYHTVIALDESQMDRAFYAPFSTLPDIYTLFSKLFFRFVNGQAAVFIFFVLSGAVLFQSLAREDSNSIRLCFNFLTRRLLRIYPATIVCVAFIALILFMIGHSTDLPTTLANFSLLSTSLNIPMWTLSVEVAAIPFLVTAFLFYRNFGLFGFLTCAITIHFCLHALSGTPGLEKISYYWIHFAFGMLVPTQIGRFVAERMPRWSWIVSLVLIVTFRSTLQLVAIWLLINAIFHHRAAALSGVLSTALSIFLGRISFGVYLYHYIFVSIVSGYAKDLNVATSHPIEVGTLLSIVVLIPTIPCALLSAFLIEEPVMRMARHITTQRFKAGVRGLNSPVGIQTK